MLRRLRREGRVIFLSFIFKEWVESVIIEFVVRFGIGYRFWYRV